jgi:hypothetical protein
MGMPIHQIIALSRNVGHQSPSASMSHRIRTEDSTAPLRKPTNLHFHPVWLSNSFARAHCVSSSLTFHSCLFSSCLWCIIYIDCYIYGLFNDTLSNSRFHGVEWLDDYRTMNSKTCGRKQSWPDLKCYSDPANSGLYNINRAVNLSVCLHYS